MTARAYREEQQGLAAVVIELGNLLAEFPLGNPGLNNQIAIAAYVSVLQVYTEAELPDDWAMTNNNLGNAYRNLAHFSANPAEQIQKAIAAYANALRVRTETESPHNWAMTNNCLGSAYHALAPFSANPAEQIEKAIAAYANTLRVDTEAEQPHHWAMTKNNLGIAYRDLAPFSPNPAEQIQKAIAAYANALRVRTETELPQAWAGTNHNLGNAYQDLATFSTNPAEQIEKAIAAFTNTLRVYTEAEQPHEWAQTNNILGNAYRNLATFSANPAEQIEKAIAAYANALRVYTEAELPQAYAMTNNNLGAAYSALAHFTANPAEQIQKSIAACANALRVFTEAEHPQAWATTNHNLGAAYSALASFSVNPAEQIQKSMAAYANALRVFTEAELPQAWAGTNNNLGNAYRDLAPFSAKPAEQIEKAIAVYANALRVYTEAELPDDWAMTINNLGEAYRNLAPFSANPAEQIQKAIAAYANALRVFTEAERPQDWAKTNNNLGAAYRILAPLSANPAEKIEKAIEAYAIALRVFTEEEQPHNWATSNSNLGNAYCALAPISAKPAEKIEKAIEAYANALRVFTEAEQSHNWATTNCNLGNAYRDLATLSAKPAEKIEKAIAAYANALRVFTKAEHPQAWATTNNNLGTAYSALAPFCANPAEQIGKAIAAYANALRVRDPVQRSSDCLQTARNLGDLGFTNNLPDVAIKGYLLAITAVENLRSVAIDPARKAEILSQAIEVYANLVQVYVDQQRFDQALEVADRSKARNLVDLLSTKDLYPKGEIPVDVIRRLDELRGSIARAERELNRGEKLGGSELRPEAGLNGRQRSDDNLRQLKQDLDRLIQAEIIEIDPTFSLSQRVMPLSIEQLRATLPDERTVFVSWYVAGPKLIAFILAKNSSELICHRYSEPTLELLIEELRSYFPAYASNRSAWFFALPETLNRLSVLLEMEALVGHIAKIAPQADHLILVPHRFLHLLPIHSLPFGDPTTTLVDQFSRGVRFAPSLQVLDVVQKRPQTPLQSLFALQNPTEDLLYTELEVAEIQALFAPRATVLQRQEATKTAMAEQAAVLASNACLHFSCHGYFNFAKPELSALILGGSTIKPAPPDADPNRYLAQRDGSALDLSQCLTLLDLFALDLRQARLVALSACETGLSELNSLSDEFVGLSSGFLYAGCNSVIGTLWTVNDLSTGLLMGEFYRLLKQQEQTQPSTDVALALKQAQQWLRQLTCAEAVATLQRLVPSLDADGQETAKRSIRRSLSERYAADDRPYHHPFYWAAFCAVGQ